MRKVTASFFLSLDGVTESPENWHFPYMDQEVGAVVGESIASTGAFLLGRQTYEDWVGYWPNQSAENNPMAAAINGLPKYVASTTLGEVAWENSHLLGADVPAEVAKLKEQPGNDIAISGSATLVRSLLEVGLIDELRLMIHPIVVGSGARLFDGDMEQLKLELVHSQTFDTGVVYVTYRPAS